MRRPSLRTPRRRSRYGFGRGLLDRDGGLGLGSCLDRFDGGFGFGLGLGHLDGSRTAHRRSGRRRSIVALSRLGGSGICSAIAANVGWVALGEQALEEGGHLGLEGRDAGVDPLDASLDDAGVVLELALEIRSCGR